MNVRSTRSGFTIVELVVAMSLVAIVAAIALPRINVGKARTDGAAREVAYLLLGAQQRAVLRQHDVVVRFDTLAGAIVMFDDRDRDGIQEVGETSSGWVAPEGVRFGRVAAPALGAGGGAVTFAAPPGAGRLPELVFHRSGSASEWGHVYLSSERAASYPEESRAVDVDRATGRVEVLMLRSGAWTRVGT